MWLLIRRDEEANPLGYQTDTPIVPGLYAILLTNWPLENEVEGMGRVDNLPEYYNSKEAIRMNGASATVHT